MAKPFSFTYSKLKNYEKCPLQHKAVDIDKLYGADISDALDFGQRVHDTLHKALKFGQELPVPMRHLQYWVDWVNQFPGTKHIEQSWGMDRHYHPAEYFSGFAWMRFKSDVAITHGPVGWLIDWKTGKRLEEPLQLWLGAIMMFCQFPELERIESMFIWLKEDDGKNSHECISVETVWKNETHEIWEQVLPRVQAYEQAIIDNVFPARPSRACQYCRVQSCDFFGKGNIQ